MESLEENAPLSDPPMSEYHRKLLSVLRATFPWPYSVHNVKDGLVNDAKLTWNPDFWVEKDRKKTLLIKALGPDTTAENLDARMRDAFGVMAFLDKYRDRIALSAPRSALIVPDAAIEGMTDDSFLVYIYTFEEMKCEIVTEKNVGELEIYRDDEDRGITPTP